MPSARRRFSLSAAYAALALLLLAAPEARAQVCEGDVWLLTQAEVDAFDCTEVMGSLTVGIWPGNSDVVDLDGLSGLTTVGSELVIWFNPVLMDVNGLAALTSTGGGVEIIGNSILANLDGLAALTSIGGELWIYDNSALAEVEGLAALTTIGGYLGIERNGALADVDGLAALTSIGGYLLISENDVLTDLDGFTNLTTVEGFLQIRYNNVLTNLDGLAALISVGGLLRIQENPALADVDGLGALTTVGSDLGVTYNESLGSCTVGLALLLSGDGIGGNVYIHDNAPGCNSVCEVLDTCPVATEGDAPLATGLAPLHPNPARGAATLTYTLAAPASVALTVYDARGRRVATLAEGEQPAGTHRAPWPSAALPAGVYVVRLAVGEEAWTQRVTLVR